MARNRYKAAVIVLPAILLAGLACWLVIPALYSGKAGVLATVATIDPQDASGPSAATDTPDFASSGIVPLDRLHIVRQSWRRGGLGSRALVTLAIRNANDFPVKDMAFECAFGRRDSPYVTRRILTLNDTVRGRGRKVFARVHVGFVSISADRAKCSLTAASRA